MRKKKSSIFSTVPVKNVKRNQFDLSHEVKMSGKFGFLYPILCLDTLPGDNMVNTTSVFMRLAPMLAPIMHRIDVTVHFFFVPMRLMWDNWEEFITGGQDGTEAPVTPRYSIPSLIGEDPTGDIIRKRSLWDYLGFPVLEGATPGAQEDVTRISPWAFRAYGKVWNDFYRDPNFDAELDLNTQYDDNVTGYDYISGLFTLRRRMWERDYFTSALPFAQRGAQVLLPLAGQVDVTYKDTSDWAQAGVGLLPAAGDPNFAGGTAKMRDFGGTNLRVENIDSAEVVASDISINDVRRAFALQTWMENNARGGARYNEQISVHFQVTVPDFRLQMAEYLGGGRQPVQISEVLSTADTDDVPVGDMAGKGISVGRSNKFNYFCQEHGVVLGVLSVTPRTAYDQGMPRMWTRTDKFDYAFPELAHIGEQEILSREIFFGFSDAADGPNVGVFGYTPRFAEYKFMNDRVAGDFRDNLGIWHLGRNFTQRPTLDEVFTTVHEETGYGEETLRRIFNVTDGTDYLWMQLYHKLSAKRPLPYFGVPRIQ